MNIRVCALAMLAAGFGAAAGAQEIRPAGQERVGFEKAAYPFEGEVTCDRLNYRLFPKADANGIVAGVLAQGSRVVVVGDQGEYLRILPPKGCHVWVSTRNVKRDSETEGTILVDDTPARIDSRANAEKLASLAEGSRVRIQREHLGWFQITPPESVAYFVSSKYVKNVGPANVEIPGKITTDSLPRGSKADDEALALMRTAEGLVDAQHRLIGAQNLEAVNFDRVVELYTLAAGAATSDEIRRSAEAGARKYRDFMAQVAMTRMRLKEISDLRSAATRKTEQPRFDYTGYVDTVGPLWNRPGTHKLVMADRVICFLRIREGDEAMRLRLNGLFRSYVGVRGVVTRDPQGWNGFTVVEVETVEEIVRK